MRTGSAHTTTREPQGPAYLVELKLDPDAIPAPQVLHAARVEGRGPRARGLHRAGTRAQRRRPPGFPHVRRRQPRATARLPAQARRRRVDRLVPRARRIREPSESVTLRRRHRLAARARRAVPVTGAVPEARVSSLVVVTDDHYPPYLFRADDGTLQGIVKDRWQLWSERNGVPVEVRGIDWSSAQASVRDRHADVIDAIADTSGRAGPVRILRKPRRHRGAPVLPPRAHRHHRRHERARHGGGGQGRQRVRRLAARPRRLPFRRSIPIPRRW